MTAEATGAHLHSQRKRFDTQAERYSSHHGHPLNQEYRDRFIRQRALGDLLRPGLRVLDAMCGGGEETGYLIASGAEVEGLDLSEEFAAAYRRQWDRPCVCASITDTGLADDSFDIVYVCGGLHHIHPELDKAIDECHRVLRPGGKLVVVEPDADSWTDRLRRLWYRFDRRFGSDEAAISIRRHLTPLTSGRFALEREVHAGGPAYVVIGQSFILSSPEWLRRRLAGVLFRVEALIERTPLNPKFFVIARFEKVSSKVSG